MIARLFFYVLVQGLGAALGYGLAGAWGAVTATVAVLWLLFLIDWLRLTRWLRWLQGGADAPLPLRWGVLAEAAHRMQRLLRSRDSALETSERHLQGMLAALQASPNGVLLLDAQRRIAWCNQNAANHLGIDAERDRLQHLGNLLRDPAFAAYLAGKDYTRELVLSVRGDTDTLPLRLSVQLCPYGDGQTLMLTRDVTALEQAEAMRRDFVANVSHEIRTPLTVLAGFVETMQTLPLDAAETTRYLALMAQQAQRMQRVVEDLLTLSRLEASPAPATDHWLSIATMVAQCEQEARALAETMDAAPQLRFPSAEQAAQWGDVAGAEAELHSALFNLVGNALRYTPATGSVHVRFDWQDDGSAVFSVADTGPGIAPEHLPRITERFYRVDRSRSRETGGTGLGLAIAKHVAQRHGAQLRIESTLAKGSTFSVVFPAERLRRAR